MESSSPLPLEAITLIIDGELSILIISLISLIVLLLSSALVSGSEVAFFSLSPNEINDLQDTQDKKSEKVLTLLKHPKELLASILILNNFINIAIVILSSYIAKIIMPEALNQTFKFFLEIVCITFIILMVGEIIPKVYATKNSISLSKLMANPLFSISNFILFKALRNVVVKSTRIFSHIENNSPGMSVSSDELEHALELTLDENTDQEEHRILKGIVKFGTTEVSQIMKSRVDVFAVEINTSYADLMGLILEAGYSRIPIYKDGFDDVQGVLYIKDLLPFIDENGDFEWQKLIRETMYVPENKKIDDLLKEFQLSRMHMAIVVDEYGGSSGIVTLEDILEEIVGEITDEFDDDELVYSKIDEYNYVFDGKTLLIDLYKVLDIDGEYFEDKKGEAESIAGFLLELSGKILRKNERITFNNYTFTVEAADKRRIKLVKVTINPNYENEVR